MLTSIRRRLASRRSRVAIVGALLLLGLIWWLTGRPSPDVDDPNWWLGQAEATTLGDVDRAIAIATQLPNTRLRAELLQTIARAVLETGQSPSLLRHMRSTKDRHPRSALQMGAAEGAADMQKATPPRGGV